MKNTKTEILMETFNKEVFLWRELMNNMFPELNKEISEMDFCKEAENGYPAGTLWIEDNDGWLMWFDFKTREWIPEGHDTFPGVDFYDKLFEGIEEKMNDPEFMKKLNRQMEICNMYENPTEEQLKEMRDKLKEEGLDNF